mmetsp:Transcript_90601/g.194269  ORF Transcript_90601/g.194269 Transcript_90601/m.194269 type:complete len:219 (-) Transcript_90601:326-982(-)
MVARGASCSSSNWRELFVNSVSLNPLNQQMKETAFSFAPNSFCMKWRISLCKSCSRQSCDEVVQMNRNASTCAVPFTCLRSSNISSNLLADAMLTYTNGPGRVPEASSYLSVPVRLFMKSTKEIGVSPRGNLYPELLSLLLWTTMNAVGCCSATCEGNKGDDDRSDPTSNTRIRKHIAFQSPRSRSNLASRTWILESSAWKCAMEPLGPSVAAEHVPS